LAARTSFDGHCHCGEVAIDEQFKYEGIYMGCPLGPNKVAVLESGC